MSKIIRLTTYTITAAGVLALLGGLATGNPGAASLGFLLAFVFGTMSALLNVKRVF